MVNSFYTYLHCRPSGEPFYVGKGSKRRSHEFNNRTIHHKRVVAKHGRENVKVYIFHCESEQQAIADEIQQIAQLRADGVVLVNLCDGGEGTSGTKWSADAIARRSASVRGKKRSEATRLKMSLAQRGRKPSPETRAKLAEAARGKSLSEAAREKLRIANLGNTRALGYKHTPDELAAITERFRNLKRTPEHCANISAALRARAALRRI